MEKVIIMRILKNSFLVILVILIVMGLTGCESANNSEDLKQKVIQEIEYLDSSLINILNKLNNITLENYTVTSKKIITQEEKKTNQSGEQGTGSDENSTQEDSEKSDTSVNIIEMVPNTILVTNREDVDWDSIKNEIELINSSWSVIALDFYNLIQDNTDILAFGDEINNCVISIKNENKEESLINMARLYNYIPKFLELISAQNSTQNIKQIKSKVIDAYVLVEREEWNSIISNLEKAESNFQNLINDIEYNRNNQNKVNKAYVIFKDLQSSIINQDKELFYMKYKNLIECLNMK